MNQELYFNFFQSNNRLNSIHRSSDLNNLPTEVFSCFRVACSPEKNHLILCVQFQISCYIFRQTSVDTIPKYKQNNSFLKENPSNFMNRSLNLPLATLYLFVSY